MNREEINKKLNDLTMEWNRAVGDSNLPLLAIESLLLEYLKTHPYDTDLWIKLALAQNTVPLADWPGAINSLNQVLGYDPTNAKALLLKAYIHDIWGKEDAQLNEKLTTLQGLNVQEQALIFYVQSWYYSRLSNEAQKELMLKKSIAVYPKFVSPHLDLAELYCEQKKYAPACWHYTRALKNIRSVFNENDAINILDFDDLFYDEIMRLEQSASQIEEIAKLRDECCALCPKN